MSDKQFGAAVNIDLPNITHLWWYMNIDDRVGGSALCASGWVRCPMTPGMLKNELESVVELLFLLSAFRRK